MEYKVAKKVLGFDINAVAYKIGPDIAVIIYGGERSHVGSVSIAASNDIARSTVISTHKDNIISEIYAKKLADVFSCNVSVTCGIHYENPSKEDLNTIVCEAEVLLEELITSM